MITVIIARQYLRPLANNFNVELSGIEINQEFLNENGISTKGSNSTFRSITVINTDITCKVTRIKTKILTIHSKITVKIKEFQ